MIPQIVKKWEENKFKLEEYFKTTDQEKYSRYSEILTKIFELVINDSDTYDNFAVNKMVEIDHGSYQGTVIFIIPKDTYQPSLDEYLITDTFYGSCSGCDTLLGISRYEDGIPSQEQVDEYMTLALHLIQKIKWLNE